jgi:hypothetical protein
MLGVLGAKLQLKLKFALWMPRKKPHLHLTKMVPELPNILLW